MNDALKIGLLVAGGFLLWRAFTSATSAGTTISQPIVPLTPAPSTGGSAPALNNALVAQLTQAAPGYYQGSGNWPGTYNVSQWNWILNNVVKPGTSAAQLPQFGLTQQIDAATYVSALQSAGLAGLGRRPRVWRAV